MSMIANTAINLRISQAEKALIDEAAQALGKSRSAFILENSLKASRDVLLDRNHFTLKGQQWTAFVEALDAKPDAEQAKGLAKLFSAPFPW